ncbi:hypothetical protein [Hymenobacter cavernae]|uniref:Uncharacterized protein n=1 Tax=Hymenobacter cavernae TaxID=2044852 RepID=A0ABQ1UWP3_9BACT|nr:hypothetical protein [Hymenobacter cavernae]GGF28926.1 hypothetical protein GCM10011383_45800 [Hymenobacter cavernae]
MLKKFAILVGVDVVGLGLWIWTEQPGNDMAILGVVVPPVLLLANLLLVLLSLLLQQRGWQTAFLLNAVAAPLLYGLLLTSWFRYSLAHQFTTFTFTQGQKHYTLTLHKRSSGCDILERQSPSTSLGLLTGEYRVSNDTTYLRDPRRGEHCFLYHGYLYQFQGSTQRIPLQSAE